jgi:hypothetical protein
VIEFFPNLPNPSSRTQSLREMSSRNRKIFLENQARPVRDADNLTSICEAIT